MIAELSHFEIPRVSSHQILFGHRKRVVTLNKLLTPLGIETRFDRIRLKHNSFGMQDYPSGALSSVQALAWGFHVVIYSLP